MTVIGHNSSAGERLRAFIERLERCEEEIKALNGDKKEIYSEAKGTGFEPKVMREVLKLRRLDKAALQEKQALLETYLHALGMGDDWSPPSRARTREGPKPEPAPEPAPSDDDPLGD